MSSKIKRAKPGGGITTERGPIILISNQPINRRYNKWSSFQRLLASDDSDLLGAAASASFASTLAATCRTKQTMRRWDFSHDTGVLLKFQLRNYAVWVFDEATLNTSFSMRLTLSSNRSLRLKAFDATVDRLSCVSMSSEMITFTLSYHTFRYQS